MTLSLALLANICIDSPCSKRIYWFSTTKTRDVHWWYASVAHASAINGSLGNVHTCSWKFGRRRIPRSTIQSGEYLINRGVGFYLPLQSISREQSWKSSFCSRLCRLHNTPKSQIAKIKSSATSATHTVADRNLCHTQPNNECQL